MSPALSLIPNSPEFPIDEKPSEPQLLNQDHGHHGRRAGARSPQPSPGNGRPRTGRRPAALHNRSPWLVRVASMLAASSTNPVRGKLLDLLVWRPKTSCPAYPSRGPARRLCHGSTTHLLAAPRAVLTRLLQEAEVPHHVIPYGAAPFVTFSSSSRVLPVLLRATPFFVCPLSF